MHYLTPHELRLAAVTAGLDPRSITSYLAGKPQRSTTRARARHALKAIGREDLCATSDDAKRKHRVDQDGQE